MLNFAPFILAFCYLNRSSYQLDQLRIIIIVVNLYIIYHRLLTCKRSVIDLNHKTITISPNKVFKFWQTDRLIKFSDIKDIKTVCDGFLTFNKRFNIKLILKNSQTLDIISTKEKEDSEEIKKLLLTLI